MLSCPNLQGGATLYPAPEPITILLIDAVHPRHVDAYTTRGSICGEAPRGPSMHPAHQLVSVPFWPDPQQIALQS